MRVSVRERFRLLPNLFWAIVAGAFAVYSVLRDSLLKDLTPTGSLAIVGGCVILSAVVAIVISALRQTDAERAAGAYQHYARSVESFDVGNYEPALTEALLAVKEDPSKPVHWSRVGRSALRLCKLDMAIEYFTKALELDRSRENKTNHLHNRGLAFYLNGNYRRAERDFLDCIGMSPRSPVTLYHLSANALAMGDYVAACLFAERSVSIGRPASLAVQSAALMAADNKHASAEALSQALSMNPERAADHYYIAAARLAFGDFENFKREIRLASQKDPKYREWFLKDPLFASLGDEPARTKLLSEIL